MTVKQAGINIPNIVTRFERADIYNADDAEDFREGAVQFAKDVSALLLDIDATECETVRAIMARYGLVL